jgi:hypothetical protein
MLARYAAVELEPGRPAPRAMASVLVATSVGAVLGPNLMQPSGGLVASWDVTPLIGSYLVAAVVYLAGVGIVVRARSDLPPVGARSLPIDGPTGRPTDVTDPDGPDEALRRGPSALTGLGVLVVANLVMVGVMTMAPVHLAHLGGSLWVVGLVVSAHIGAMFGPSALSGWLTERFGAHGTALLSAGVLVVACAVAATAGHSTFSLGVAMVLLGAGWNGCLVSGSDLLTRGVGAPDRPRQESLGELGMAVAAAVGGATSGLAMARWDYGALALLGGIAASTLCAGLILVLVHTRRVRYDGTSRT